MICLLVGSEANVYVQVLQSLGLSYNNFHALNETLEQIPERAGKWFTRGLSFRDKPDEIYILRGRDPVEAVRSLWGDPTLAEHLVYRPSEVFADATRVNRLYSEMWTGEWWNEVQVRVLFVIFAHGTHNLRRHAYQRAQRSLHSLSPRTRLN